MHLYPVVLLVAAVVLVNVQRSTSFQLTTADYPTVVIRSFVDQNSVAPRRLLRRYDEEERAIGGGTISELATKLKGSPSNLAKNMMGTNYENFKLIS
ncbi:Putative RxLR effector [Phytophthora palmivora]|uniref:RxLR effector n=1 Tax=Phytophthora palmivora TaxID=4796 RepID=A0A2P4XEJ5_9STRA|nr:Putative RxLR effector [Phytophthora palmivora]